jgi:hypothetical protein
MKTKLAVLSACLLLIMSTNAQVTSGYTENVAKGHELYNNKDYLSSAKAYSLAFALNGGKGTGTDRYNAACSWALAGNTDSAFFYLFGAAEKNSYDNYNHIIQDTDLNTLHSDKRWNTLLEKIKANKEKAEANFIKPVVAILDTVYIDDQKYRKGIMELIQKEGMQSPVVQERLKQMEYADSINLIKVQKILDEYGWLGFDQVGRQGALTIFLVIQHSPLKVQQKYLPMMREAVAKKQAVPGNLALLEDRVAMREGKKQIYGSQVHTDSTGRNFLAPLEDPDNVDKRRAQVGLGPLADYLKQFGIKWDLEEYKKQQRPAPRH